MRTDSEGGAERNSGWVRCFAQPLGNNRRRSHTLVHARTPHVSDEAFLAL